MNRVGCASDGSAGLMDFEYAGLGVGTGSDFSNEEGVGGRA